MPPPTPLEDVATRLRVKRKIAVCDSGHRGCGCRQINSLQELTREEEEEEEDEEERIVDYLTRAEECEETEGGRRRGLRCL